LKVVLSIFESFFNPVQQRSFLVLLNMAPHPDSDLHPTATGLAKATVDRHQEPQNLVLYAGWFCPFVQRVWIVLEEKNIPYQYVEVNPYHKPESLMKLNPRGLVPTLQYDGKPLYESTVVCEFLEDAYPDHGKRLHPEDPYQRAVGRIWSDYITSRIIPKYFRFLQHEEGKTPYSLEEARQEFLDSLKDFTNQMDKEGPFFFGKEPMLVDFIAAPFEQRIWVFDHFKGGLGIPAEGEGGKDEEVWGRWRQWASAIQNRKSVKETTSDREHSLPIYKR
jgi:glutathione S-transferase